MSPDLLTLIRAQRAGSLRPHELADLMARLESIFASEDAPREGATAAGRTRLDSAIRLLRQLFGDHGDDGGSIHLVCREVEATLRDLTSAHEEIDALREHLAAAKGLLRVAEPIVGAAETLTEVMDGPVDVDSLVFGPVAAVCAAVKAARAGRVKETKPLADVDLLAAIHNVATGKTRHIYAGTCPEAWPEGAGTENDRADLGDECPACDVLSRVDATLAAIDAARIAKAEG